MCDEHAQAVRALRVVLQEAGYRVGDTGTLAGARRLLARDTPEAAIIDVALPDGDGIELCAELRSWSTMAVLVLSAAGEEERKVRTLQAGADDNLTKPFSSRELLARLEALFRRATADGEEAVVFVKGLEINFAEHRVLRNGRDVGLTPTEFALLRALARNRGRLSRSSALLAEVWGTGYGEDLPLLRTHIANLRHKIEAGGASTWLYIQTEPGLGYRFCD